MSKALPPDTSVPVAEAFNPFSPDQCRDPHAICARARVESPVFFSPVMDMWVVSRYRDVEALIRDHKRFSSAQFLTPEFPPEVIAVLQRGYPLVPTMVDNDPPEHTRIRKLCNRAFTPRRIAAMEPHIRALASSLVDEFAADGRADLIARFAAPLSRSVVADITGVPRQDIGRFGAWADAAMALFFAKLPLQQMLTCAHAFVEFQNYNQDMIETRRREPRDDLLTSLIQAQLEEEGRIDNAEINSVLIALLIAGHMTTTDFIGNALIQIVRRPDHIESIRRDRRAMDRFLEEVLRIESVIPGVVRMTTEEVEVGGQLIPKGARVYVMYGSANRDESVFASPATFDIERDASSRHFGFGHGIHYCLGAPLARLEGRIAMEVVLDRLADLRLHSDANLFYPPSLLVRGVERLDLCWNPAIT